jgi:hypothetical protein
MLHFLTDEWVSDSAAEVEGQGHREGRVNLEGIPEESGAGGFLVEEP